MVSGKLSHPILVVTLSEVYWYADILLTLEYTALHSFDYRQQVIQTLDLYDVALPSVCVCRARRFLKYTAEVAALIRKFKLEHCLSTTIRKSTLSPISWQLLQ
jgi:hypothetical protein